MRLTSFSVRQYRSIIEAERLPLGDLTILIGPNNEGKSNILRALVVGMRLLRQARTIGVIRGQYRVGDAFRNDYNWERDFPVTLQESSLQGDSTFDFEFLLDDEETAAFYREVGSNLNGILPVRLSVNSRRALFQVRKRGPGARALTAKRDEITAFLSSRIDLEYVPAVRTGQGAIRVVGEMVDQELAAAEDNPEFTEVLAKIEELQRPILNALSASLTDTIRDFLPRVSAVIVDVTREARSTALRRDYSVIVDDGTPTDLRQKGDGVQSLAALSLIRHASQRSAKSREQILAVEEPEAHLHPDAIHQLRRVLQDIALRQQVIVTTHCPLLINRLDVKSNIVVEASQARPAANVREIRDVLGVRTSDNLAAADVVLVVEGESDRLALRALLAEADPRLASALADGVLAIDQLHGGSNLRYKLSLIRDSLCVPHAYLDNDDTGRDAGQRAIDEGLLTPADLTLTICPGMANSEIEDLLDRDVYGELIRQRYGVDLSTSAFRNNLRWTERMRAIFRAAGKPWDERVQKDVKVAVAEAVAASPATSLHPAKRSSFDGLVQELRSKLEEL